MSTILLPSRDEVALFGNKEFKSFLKKVDTTHCMWPTRLDVYGNGCEHNCEYCYSKVILCRYKKWNPKNPGIADISKIGKCIQRLPSGILVRMGGMTDCFMPLEMRIMNALNTMQMLNERGIHYLIVTKSCLLIHPRYLAILDKELAHIQVSLTSLDPFLQARYDHGCHPQFRIDTVLELQERGFDVALRLSPLLEEHMDFDKLNSLGIKKCIVEFLRHNNSMIQLPKVDYSKYNRFHRNYYHLPLQEKLRIIDKIKIPTISVCEKHYDDYDYWKGNFNPNPADCCNLCFNKPLGNKDKS